MERVDDLKAILNELSWRGALGVETDERVFAAGFSAGAYTALLAGARIAFSHSLSQTTQRRVSIRGPREFPNLADELPKLYENPVFQISLGPTTNRLFLTAESALRSQLLQAVLSWASRKIVFRLM